MDKTTILKLISIKQSLIISNANSNVKHNEIKHVCTGDRGMKGNPGEPGYSGLKGQPGLDATQEACAGDHV